jgi:cell division septation protein DedD
LSATGGFVVQVGAFSARDNAERARALASSAGPAALVEMRGLHRVRVGPVADRAEAERIRTAVIRLGFAGAMVAPLR